MNDANLKPFNTLTESEQREIARQGGIASGEARREKRKMREIFTDLLALDTVEGISTKEAIAIAMIQKAKEGNIRAFETILDTIGELKLPPEKENIVFSILGYQKKDGNK